MPIPSFDINNAWDSETTNGFFWFSRFHRPWSSTKLGCNAPATSWQLGLQGAYPPERLNPHSVISSSSPRTISSSAFLDQTTAPPVNIAIMGPIACCWGAIASWPKSAEHIHWVGVSHQNARACCNVRKAQGSDYGNGVDVRQAGVSVMQERWIIQPLNQTWAPASARRWFHLSQASWSFEPATILSTSLYMRNAKVAGTLAEVQAMDLRNPARNGHLWCQPSQLCNISAIGEHIHLRLRQNTCGEGGPAILDLKHRPNPHEFHKAVGECNSVLKCPARHVATTSPRTPFWARRLWGSRSTSPTSPCQ